MLYILNCHEYILFKYMTGQKQNEGHFYRNWDNPYSCIVIWNWIFNWTSPYRTRTSGVFFFRTSGLVKKQLRGNSFHCWQVRYHSQCTKTEYFFEFVLGVYVHVSFVQSLLVDVLVCWSVLFVCRSHCLRVSLHSLLWGHFM